MFEEFVVPYYCRCYDAFPGSRGLHMCGKINHLIPILAKQLEITHLNGFGFPASPALLAEWMGGRTVMSGGLNPVLLLRGPREAIKAECYRYLEAFAPCGGYILQDGNNVAPGTPLEHLAAVVEAAQEFSGQDSRSR
jgi:uroporphyrinogen-III decarboxylase